MKFKILKGFEQNPGSENGNTNLPPSRPTQSTFPPTDNTGRPMSSVFAPSSTSGTYSTDGSEGTSAGDFSTTSIGGTSFPETSPNSRPSSLSPDDLYTIKNNYPTTYPSNNRNPQTTGNQPDDVTPTRPVDTNRPTLNIPPQKPHHIEPDRPPPHHPYPLGPDPFPGYFPHIHPHYHYNVDDHDYIDDKDSHFPGIYAHNSPSLHDRFYPGAPQPPPPLIHTDHYGSGGLYASGRYPETDIHLSQSGYSGNRKNGYQVTDNTPDIPMTKRE